jgi:hypothetical protein
MDNVQKSIIVLIYHRHEFSVQGIGVNSQYYIVAPVTHHLVENITSVPSYTED